MAAAASISGHPSVSHVSVLGLHSIVSSSMAAPSVRKIALRKQRCAHCEALAVGPLVQARNFAFMTGVMLDY